MSKAYLDYADKSLNVENEKNIDLLHNFEILN
jgi:hypothetical protein